VISDIAVRRPVLAAVAAITLLTGSAAGYPAWRAAGRTPVALLRGAELRIAADRPFTVYADGDPIGELPVTVRAVPAALRVLLPTTP